MRAFQACRAGAEPAWRTNFASLVKQTSRDPAKVQVHVRFVGEAPILSVGDVIAAYEPVKLVEPERNRHRGPFAAMALAYGRRLDRRPQTIAEVYFYGC